MTAETARQCLYVVLLWIPLPAWTAAYVVLLFAGYPRGLSTGLLASLVTYLAGAIAISTGTAARWQNQRRRNPLLARIGERALERLGLTPLGYVLHAGLTWPSIYTRLLAARHPAHRSTDAAHRRP